jgi:hypothetical protein
MAVGLSVDFSLARPYGPGRCCMPPKHMRAFEFSSQYQQVDPDTDMTVIHI